jgi:cytochrome P450
VKIDMLSDYTDVDTTDTFRLIAEDEEIVEANTGELIIVRYQDVRELLPAIGLTTQRPPRDLEVLATLPAAAREVQLAMKSHYAKWPLLSDGDYHKRLKRHLARSMSGPAEVVAKDASDHVRAVRRATAEGQFSWLQRVAEPIAASVIGTILGIPLVEAAVLIGWATAIVNELAWPVMDDRRAADAVRAQQALADWLRQALPLASGSTRYMQALRAIGDDPALGFDSAVATLAQTITGAYDPVVSIITTLALTVHQEALVTLSPETLTEEVLRLGTPFRVARRFTTAPTRIVGHDLPPGCRFFLGLATANLDPRVFPGPTSMARRPSPHVAFGLGRHYCLGAEVVRHCLSGVVSGLASVRATFTAHRIRYAPELSILRYTVADGSWQPY